MSNNITKKDFDEIFIQYSGSVYGLALAMAKTKRKALSITRRVFSELIFENGDKKREELKYILFSNAFQKGKKVMGGGELPSDWAEVWDKSDENKESAPLDEFEEILKGTDKFDIKQRQVLILSGENFSDEVISEITEIPVQTVKWLTQQNKKELKDAGYVYSKYIKEVPVVLCDEPSELFEKMIEKYESDFSEDEEKSRTGLYIGIILAAAVIIGAVIWFFLK